MKALNTLTLSEDDIIECIEHSLRTRGIIPELETAVVDLSAMTNEDGDAVFEADVSFKIEPVKPRRRRKKAGMPVSTEVLRGYGLLADDPETINKPA